MSSCMLSHCCWTVFIVHWAPDTTSQLRNVSSSNWLYGSYIRSSTVARAGHASGCRPPLEGRTQCPAHLPDLPRLSMPCPALLDGPAVRASDDIVNQSPAIDWPRPHVTSRNHFLTALPRFHITAFHQMHEHLKRNSSYPAISLELSLYINKLIEILLSSVCILLVLFWFFFRYFHFVFKNVWQTNVFSERTNIHVVY